MSTIRHIGSMLIASAALAFAAACGGSPATEARSHRVLDDGLEPLRVAFNADSGKVRAIFLASPT